MRRWALVASCILMAIGFAALGAWQIERRAEKHALIARVEARVHAAAQPLPHAAVGPAPCRRTLAHRAAAGYNASMEWIDEKKMVKGKKKKSS